MRGRQCIGFGVRDGTCTNEAGTPWTPLWCLPCDEARRAHITTQMARITENFQTAEGAARTAPSSTPKPRPHMRGKRACDE